jgi:hypothetical protein
MLATNQWRGPGYDYFQAEWLNAACRDRCGKNILTKVKENGNKDSLIRGASGWGSRKLLREFM